MTVPEKAQIVLQNCRNYCSKNERTYVMWISYTIIQNNYYNNAWYWTGEVKFISQKTRFAVEWTKCHPILKIKYLGNWKTWNLLCNLTIFELQRIEKYHKKQKKNRKLFTKMRFMEELHWHLHRWSTKNGSICKRIYSYDVDSTSVDLTHFCSFYFEAEIPQRSILVHHIFFIYFL